MRMRRGRDPDVAPRRRNRDGRDAQHRAAVAHAPAVGAQVDEASAVPTTFEAALVGIDELNVARPLERHYDKTPGCMDADRGSKKRGTAWSAAERRGP